MLKQLPMTKRQQRWKRKSKSSTSSEKPKSAKTSTAEPESQASVLRTPTKACFCSAFKELIFNSLSLLPDDPHHFMTCIARLCYASHETYNALFTLLSTICHRAEPWTLGTYWPIRYSVAGLTEGFKSVRRVRRRFLLVSPSSPLGHTTLSRLLLYTFAFAITKRSS